MALGILGWPPAAFWDATPREITAAYTGFVIRQTGKRPEDFAGEQVTRAELDALMKEFPDG